MDIKKITILAIDDDAGDSEILRWNLEDIQEWEIDFHRAADTRTTLATLQNQSVDVLFVDYELGAECGIDTIKAARRTGFHNPIIVLTGMGDEGVVVDAFHAGADDYLAKNKLMSSSLRRSIQNAQLKCNLQRELKEQRAALESTNAELKKRNQEIESFSQILSHELKTPLTAAMSFAEILLDKISGPLNETQTEHLQIVWESCSQISSCIDDLLDAARIDSGKLSLEQKPEWITELVKSVVTSLQPVAEDKGVQFSTRFAPNLPQIHVDRARFRQVLTNLLNNALKFTPRGGRVDVISSASTRDPNMVQVSVMDTGRGIAIEDLDRVFDPMFQARTEDATQHGGLGIGLGLSRDLIKLHGGEIWVTSNPGNGSTFSFTLPVAEATSIPEAEPQKSILVIEDDRQIASSLAIRLEAQGYGVSTATDSAMALAMAHDTHPDLLILDVTLPGLNGFEVARQFRDEPAVGDAPIIFLTASRDPSNRARAEAMGAHAFFEKPCPSDKLIEAVRSALQVPA